MRFLMKTLLARPRSRLIHAFPAKPSLDNAWLLAAVFVSPAKPRSRPPRLLACHNYSSQSFGASSILLFKAAGTVLFPCVGPRQGYTSCNPRVGLRGRLNLKSRSRQRRPIRLEVTIVKARRLNTILRLCYVVRSFSS
jgi:hypothetical protein